jgi:hypothetical protein
MTVSGQFSCPPPGSFVAVSGQFLVSAVSPSSRPPERRRNTLPMDWSSVTEVTSPTRTASWRANDVIGEHALHVGEKCHQRDQARERHEIRFV